MEIKAAARLKSSQKEELNEQLDELGDALEDKKDKGQAPSGIELKQMQQLRDRLKNPALTAGKHEATLEVSISGSQECVDRVEALLALVAINGGVGHSGTFGIEWDGDGADYVEIKGIDTKKYHDLAEALSSHIAEVEVVSEGGTGFVKNNSREGDERYPYLKSTKVYPAED